MCVHLYRGLRGNCIQIMSLGEYQCIVENRYGATYSTKAELTVYVFPRFLTTPTDITVRGGQNAVLKCSATGTPYKSEESRGIYFSKYYGEGGGWLLGKKNLN